jgi:hypothetical protein
LRTRAIYHPIFHQTSQIETTYVEITSLTTHPITAVFNYYDSDEPIPEDDASIFTGECPHMKPFTVPVQDIRQSTESFDLDTHGFKILKHNSSLLPPSKPAGAANFHDQELMKSTYWPEITSLIREQLGARGVAIINTTVRDVVKLDLSKFEPKHPRTSSVTAIAPFFVVHGDYTATGARSHLSAIVPTFYEDLGIIAYTTPEERETFLTLRSEVAAAEDAAQAQAGIDAEHWDGANYEGPRWVMFSIWRPLATVQRSPLAIMDPRDLKGSSSLPRVYRKRPGFLPEYKSTNLLPRPPKAEGHRWYWLPEQEVDEVYAIKLYDSDGAKEAGPVLGAPHSAFELEGTDGLPPRRSVELRAIAIW